MLCPVSPSSPSSSSGLGKVHDVQEDEEEVDVSKAMLKDPIIGVEPIVGQHGDRARQARPLPVPKTLSPAQREIHDLTHLPFDEGCEICRLTRGAQCAAWPDAGAYEDHSVVGCRILFPQMELQSHTAHGFGHETLPIQDLLCSMCPPQGTRANCCQENRWLLARLWSHTLRLSL